MLGWLSHRSNKLVGLDISSTAVKMLELSHDGDSYRVDRYAVRPLPTNAVVEKNITDELGVGEAIKQTVSDANTKTNRAAVAVAGSAVITKSIEMDANLTDEEMESQIILEADQYIPYPLDEVAIDFAVEGPISDKPNRVKVLLAACRKENIELREEALRMAGIDPYIVDVEAYAMERAYQLVKDQLVDLVHEQDTKSSRTAMHNPDELIVAVVDIGSTMTTLNILYGNKIIYTREQLFGGRQLTEAIQQHYELSFEEAGLAKKLKQNTLPADYQETVLEPFKATIEKHIARSLQFFYSSSPYDHIDAVVLAGGTACIKGLIELVQDELKVPTMLADPFINMSIADTVNAKALHDDAPSLMIACGLAMRSVH